MTQAKSTEKVVQEIRRKTRRARCGAPERSGPSSPVPATQQADPCRQSTGPASRADS